MQKRVEWVKNITRPLSLLKVSTLFTGLSRLGLKDSLIVPADDKSDWYFNKEQYDRFVHEFVKSCEKGDFISELIEKCYSDCEEMIKTTQKILKLNLHEKSNKELKRLFEVFHKRLSKWPYYWISAIEFDNYVTALLKQQLKKILRRRGNEDLLEQYFTILTTKTKRIFAEQEEEELLEIRAKYESKNRRIFSFALSNGRVTYSNRNYIDK